MVPLSIVNGMPKEPKNPVKGDFMHGALAIEPGGNEYVKKKKRGAYLTHYELFGEEIKRRVLKKLISAK